MKYTLPFILMVFFLSGLYSQVEKINYRDYQECYRLFNDSINVIVSPESGGRVLQYSLHGENIIFENSSLNGKLLSDYLSDWFDPDGGRFDLGPEDNTSSIHDTLWLGPYEAKITGNYSLLITSQLDKQMGIKIKREFLLDSASSHLTVHQTMINFNPEKSHWYFWSRTLVPINGKMIVPLKESSSYPLKWGKYYTNPWRFVYDNPQDALVTVNDSLLEYKASKINNSGKYGVDADDGWMAYGYNEMLFVKRFPYSTTGNYLEEAGQTIVFYTNGSRFVEMEPVSPEMVLDPGDSCTFDEDWWLLTYKPAINKDFNMVEATSYLNLAANFHDTSSIKTQILNFMEKPNQIFSIISNPVLTQVEFQIHSQSPLGCNAVLYNSEGKQLRVVVVSVNDFFAGKCIIPVHDLNNGFYLCQFRMNGYSQSIPFIIHR